jgi:hypothetical protein
MPRVTLNARPLDVLLEHEDGAKHHAGTHTVRSCHYVCVP